MLLHNQKGAALRWEAGGVAYEWEPFGSCNVPDLWLSHLKAQGYPVGPEAVTPREQVERAAVAEQDAQAKTEATQLQRKLAEAETRTAQATKAAEVAAVRETAALERAEQAESKLEGLTAQVARMKSDAEAYEKLLTEANQRISELERPPAPPKTERKAVPHR